MFRNATIAAALVAWVVLGCTPAEGPLEASEVLADAGEAMGTANLDSISYSGSASNLTNFMQSRSASNPSLVEVANYTRAIDFTEPASRATGEMMVVGTFGGDPQPQAYNQNATADSGWAQQMEIWLTPWGFLEGAAANGATARSEGGQTVITWMTPDSVTAPSGLHYTVQGYLDGDGRVQRVETWVEDNIAGDMHIEAAYSDYMDVDGVMVPDRVVEKKAGVTYFEASPADVTINPADIAELMTPPQAGAGGRGGRGGGARGGAPPGARGGAPGAARGGAPGGRGGARGGPPAGPAEPVELAEQLDEGVWRITGGYVSLAVEFSDHVVVVEGGQPMARGRQVIDEVRRIIPDKPIRYVVNTHPHSDHSGGLPVFVAEGITIIAHENNVDFLNTALSAPRTLLADDDPLKQAPMAPKFEPVEGDLKVLEDDTMRLELHHIQNLGHQDGMLVAYLPESKILFQADFTLPTGGAEPNEFVVTLGENVQRLGLDFERYYAVHDANVLQTRDDFDAALGF